MGKEQEPIFTQEELEELYRALEKPMYNVVYRWLWDSEEARDVVQETFLRLWRERGNIRRETVRPLAYRISLNLAASRRRTRRIWKWVSLENLTSRLRPDPDPEAEVAAVQQKHLMRRVIERLPAKLKSVIALCELSEMTYEDVGKALGISPGTVGSRRNRAMKMLRDGLENVDKGK